MTDTPREPAQTDPETPDKAIAGDGKSRPEPRSFGGGNQGADPSATDYDANDGAEIAADDAGASAMAERAANDVERP